MYFFQAYVIENGNKEEEGSFEKKLEVLTPRQLAFIEAIGVKEEIRLSNLQKKNGRKGIFIWFSPHNQLTFANDFSYYRGH